MIEFRYPLVLFLYIPAIIILLYWIINSRKKRLLSNVENSLREKLLIKIDKNRFFHKERLLFSAMLLLIFSASVFAGSSHMYLPLTTDYEAARLFLDQIDTNMIPTQGTALSSALTTGLSAFTEDDSKYKVLVLVTDGEDHEGQVIDLASKASDRGMIIHTVGVGTGSGSLIPIVDQNGKREYKRDNTGQLVTSIINENLLNKIASAGKGTYVRFDNKPANFRSIMSAIDSMEKRTLKSHIYSEYEDRFQSFAIISMGLMIMGMLLPTRKKTYKE